LRCAATASGVFTVNGTLDVLPNLPNKWTPYDYAYIPASPNPALTGVKVRAYYSTEPSKTITVRHLVDHLAGYTYNSAGYSADLASLQTAIIAKVDPALLRFPLSPNVDMDTVEWAERLGKIPQMFQPGTAWVYGPQIGIAGAALVAYERNDCCGDRNIGLYEIQKRVLFDPLNITDAGYFIKNNDPRRNEKIGKLAHVYTNLDTIVFQTPTVTNPYVSVVFNGQDALLPGLQIALMDGVNPTAEGAANPSHPIYGSASPKRTEYGDAGLYMRTDEFQRIITMLTQNGTYNGQQILYSNTVAQMVSNQIGDIFIVHLADPAGNVKWGHGAAVGDGSVNPDPLAATTAHWAGSYGSWWFSNQPSSTSFTLNSNTLPGVLRPLVNIIANMTKA
jgi:CubicO group peptidase (beta-lactamase class C family)